MEYTEAARFVGWLFAVSALMFAAYQRGKLKGAIEIRELYVSMIEKLIAKHQPQGEED